MAFTVYLLLSAKGLAQNGKPKREGPAWDKHSKGECRASLVFGRALALLAVKEV